MIYKRKMLRDIRTFYQILLLQLIQIEHAPSHKHLRDVLDDERHTSEVKVIEKEL